MRARVLQPQHFGSLRADERLCGTGSQNVQIAVAVHVAQQRVVVEVAAERSALGRSERVPPRQLPVARQRQEADGTSRLARNL